MVGNVLIPFEFNYDIALSPEFSHMKRSVSSSMTLNQKHAVGEFLHRSFFHSSYDKIRFWDLKQSYANLAKVASVTCWVCESICFALLGSFQEAFYASRNRDFLSFVNLGPTTSIQPIPYRGNKRHFDMERSHHYHYLSKLLWSWPLYLFCSGIDGLVSSYHRRLVWV